MNQEEVDAARRRYEDVLKPLFFPDDPVSNDIVNYFASLLRVVGMEDKGWDPYLESRAILEDLNVVMQMDPQAGMFPDRDRTIWRIGLLMYSQIVEMDAPYEVLMNLLRFRLGKGYSPNPYYMFLDKKQRQKFRRRGLGPREKIDIIKKLSVDAGLEVGQLFDDFYRGSLRNAISHADYIFTDEEFRCRNGTGAMGAFAMSLTELNGVITKAKLFVSAFFELETSAREAWGQLKHRAIPYDPTYKGLMEVLADERGLMCGFKVHWPNGAEGEYRRTPDGIDMSNCMLDTRRATIEFMVDLYAREPGAFSPLVERDDAPRYTVLEGTGVAPTWPA